MHQTIAMIAGNRDLPIMAAKKAKELNYKLLVVAIEGEADPVLKTLADEFLEVKLGKLQPIVDFFLKHQAKDVFMIGGITRDSLTAYEPDEEAIKLLSTLTSFHTDTILRAVVDYLGNHGLNFVSIVDILPQLLVQPGQLTKTAPNQELLADLKIAWHIAKELGRLDVGQCVVVSDKITLALEGADGTDATLIRGGALAAKKAAAAKIVKPNQDFRLDPPVIGPDTVKTMIKANIAALVIDASQVLLISPDETINLANEHNIAIVAWNECCDTK